MKKNKREKAIAQIEFVKAEYRRDKLNGTLKANTYYINQFRTHATNEIYMTYLTTKQTAEELLDVLNEYCNRNAKVEQRNREIINRVKKVLDSIDPKTANIELELRAITAEAPSLFCETPEMEVVGKVMVLTIR